MSDPRAVVRRYLELFEQHDASRFEEVLAPGLRAYFPDGSLAFDGRDAWIAAHAEMDVSEVSVSEEEMLLDGDRVACRYRVEATLGDGRRVTSIGTKIYRLEDGLISEIRGHDHSEVE